MPAKPEGVYADGRGGWYFKVTLSRDPLTGKRVQITKRGYRTAAEAGRARREVLAKVDTGQVRPSSKVLTVKRIGELVALRWPNVDLERPRVHVVEFVSGLGYNLVPSAAEVAP